MKNQLLILIAALGCSGPQAEPAPAAATDSSASATAGGPNAATPDSVIFAQTIARAQAERLDTLPIGEVIARVGQWFVGTPYEPGTLEVEPEHLVINLRQFDCVTFVENMLAFGRLLTSGRTDWTGFKSELQVMRYRDSQLAGYPSRLHYFTEWIANNEEKGLVINQTRALKGVVDAEPIDFMSMHRASYRQLVNDSLFSEIRATEARLNQKPRYMVPKAGINAVAEGIRNGDIIAAASSVKGLDVAHTGIALWVNGKLHLMHAPLVGDSVEVSKAPLAERIMSIERQDGIMVARPQQPRR